MNKEEFITKLQDALNTKRTLTADMNLHSIPEWDSLSIMCVITLFSDELKIEIDYTEVEKFKTVGDLINRAGIND